MPREARYPNRAGWRSGASERIRSAGWEFGLSVGRAYRLQMRACQEADDTFGRVLQVFEGFAAAASFQSHDECEERAALTNPEVIPEILLVVHFEARRALLAQGREIHAVAVSFVPGQNAAAGKIFPDGTRGAYGVVFIFL